MRNWEDELNFADNLNNNPYIENYEDDYSYDMYDEYDEYDEYDYEESEDGYYEWWEEERENY